MKQSFIKGNKTLRAIKILGLITYLFLMTVSYAQSNSFNIDVNGDVRILIVDSNGRKMGFDAKLKKYFQEIPKSAIGSSGFENNLEINITDSSSGPYQIEIFGNSPTSYDLNFRIYAKETTKPYDKDIYGVVDSSKTVRYTFSFNPNPDFSFKVSKFVDGSVLKQSINAAWKLGSIEDSNYYNILSENIDEYQTLEAINKSKEANVVILKFKQILESGLKGDIKNASITDDLYNLLNEDIKILNKGN